MNNEKSPPEVKEQQNPYTAYFLTNCNLDEITNTKRDGSFSESKVRKLKRIDSSLTSGSIKNIEIRPFRKLLWFYTLIIASIIVCILCLKNSICMFCLSCFSFELIFITLWIIHLHLNNVLTDHKTISTHCSSSTIGDKFLQLICIFPSAAYGSLSFKTSGISSEILVIVSAVIFSIPFFDVRSSNSGFFSFFGEMIAKEHTEFYHVVSVLASYNLLVIIIIIEGEVYTGIGLELAGILYWVSFYCKLSNIIYLILEILISVTISCVLLLIFW